MLIGFTIVAAPLLFAIVNAAVQMNRFSNRSERWSCAACRQRHNQRMFVEIAALERTARLYQILPNSDLLEVYARNQERLENTLNELLALPLNERRKAMFAPSRRRPSGARGAALRAGELSAHGRARDSYPQMSDLASKISNHVSGGWIRAHRAAGGGAARAAEPVLADALARPMTLAVVGVLRTSLAVRSAPWTAPSTSSAAARSRGRSPFEARRTGAARGSARVAAGAAARARQEKNRFLRHMSHELKTPWRIFGREPNS